MKFEYRIMVVVDRTLLSEEDVQLEMAGKEGWELVSVVVSEKNKLLYLKRPRPKAEVI